MTGKYVLILKGSPRKKGNSAILADRVAEGAKAVGAEGESIYLSQPGALERAYQLGQTLSERSQDQ